MAKGRIRKLVADKGYGFIKSEEGGEVFFHLSGLRGIDFNDLKEGDLLEYDMEKDKRSGKFRAVSVRRA
ncbi:MAG: cold-shock protein [Ignavibacteriales bacterium]